MLYLVPTPIGNLEDITLRALRILKEVDVVLAEDTRTTGRLFKHYEIETPLRSYHAHNEHGVTPGLVEQLAGGTTMALVTDAGSPGISDPGFFLIRAAVEKGVKVEALPGATAIIPAITATGLPCNRFYFEGFLPHKKGRQTRLKASVCRELTKMYEEVRRGTLEELHAHYSSVDKVKGEIVIVVDGLR